MQLLLLLIFAQLYSQTAFLTVGGVDNGNCLSDSPCGTLGYVLKNITTVGIISLDSGDYTEPAVLNVTQVLLIEGVVPQLPTELPSVSLTLDSSITDNVVFFSVSSNLSISYITFYHQYQKTYFRIIGGGILTISSSFVDQLANTDPQISTPFVTLSGSFETSANLLLNATKIAELIFQGTSFIRVETSSSITIDSCEFRSLTSGVISQQAQSGTHASLIDDFWFPSTPTNLTIRNTNISQIYALQANRSALIAIGGGGTNSQVILDNVRISNIRGGSNTSQGGALFVNNVDNVIITNSVFTDIINVSDGGALYLSNVGSIVINNITVTQSTVNNDAGAIYIVGDVFNITNSSFSQNVARRNGGAICITSANEGNRYLINDTFSENSVVNGSGSDIGELSLEGVNAIPFYNSTNFNCTSVSVSPRFYFVNNAYDGDCLFERTCSNFSLIVSTEGDDRNNCGESASLGCATVGYAFDLLVQDNPVGIVYLVEGNHTIDSFSYTNFVFQLAPIASYVNIATIQSNFDGPNKLPYMIQVHDDGHLIIEFLTIIQTSANTGGGPVLVAGTNRSSMVLRQVTFTTLDGKLFQPYLVNNGGYVRLYNPIFLTVTVNGSSPIYFNITYSSFSNITIIGGSADSITVASNDSALLETSNVEGSYRITINDFSIVNTTASSTEAGGAFYLRPNNFGDIHISNVSITGLVGDAQKTKGGGIAILGGVNSLFIEFSVFTNITKVLYGGAIYKFVRSLQGPQNQNNSRITGCNISNCSASLGGGIFIQHVVISLYFVRFENNSATQGLDLYHANYTASNETYYGPTNVIDCCSTSGGSLDQNRVFFNTTAAVVPLDLADCTIGGDFTLVPRGSLIEDVIDVGIKNSTFRISLQYGTTYEESDIALDNVTLVIQAYSSSRLSNSNVTGSSAFNLSNYANLNVILCSLTVRSPLEGNPFFAVSGSTLNLTDVSVQSFRSISIHVIYIENGVNANVVLRKVTVLNVDFVGVSLVRLFDVCPILIENSSFSGFEYVSPSEPSSTVSRRLKNQDMETPNAWLICNDNSVMNKKLDITISHTIISTVSHENASAASAVVYLVSMNSESKVIFNNGTIYVLGTRQVNNIEEPRSFFIFHGIKNVTVVNSQVIGNYNAYGQRTQPIETCWNDSIFHVHMDSNTTFNNVTFTNIQGGLFGVYNGTLNLQQNYFDGVTQTYQQYHSAKKIAYCRNGAITYSSLTKEQANDLWISIENCSLIGLPSPPPSSYLTVPLLSQALINNETFGFSSALYLVLNGVNLIPNVCRYQLISPDGNVTNITLNPTLGSNETHILFLLSDLTRIIPDFTENSALSYKVKVLYVTNVDTRCPTDFTLSLDTVSIDKPSSNNNKNKPKNNTGVIVAVVVIVVVVVVAITVVIVVFLVLRYRRKPAEFPLDNTALTLESKEEEAKESTTEMPDKKFEDF